MRLLNIFGVLVLIIFIYNCSSKKENNSANIRNLSGILEVQIADDFRHGVEHRYYFLKTNGGKKYFLNLSDKELRFESNLKITVAGIVHGDTLETKITDIKLLK